MMNRDDIVCYCSGVTCGQILDAIEQGARTLSDIRRMTGACTLCQCKELSPRKECCSPVIMGILKEQILKTR